MNHLVTVGNPNSGKTTLFNALTGSKQKVGNWSGVTVDKKSGEFSCDGNVFELVDLPGIYSLDDQQTTGSVDEQIAFNYVMDNLPDLVINVIDAGSLERSLYLTLQLRELGLPLLVVVNKIESKSARHLAIDTDKLSANLGCPVVALSALNKIDVRALQKKLPAYIELSKQQHSYSLPLPSTLGAAVSLLSKQLKQPGFSSDALALRLLEGDQLIASRVGSSLVASAKEQLNDLELDLDLEVADSRYTQVYNLIQTCVSRSEKPASRFTELLDHWLLHRTLGLPLFLAIIYLLFLFTISFGGAFIDFFSIAVGAVVIEGTRTALESINAPELLIILLADGVGDGITTVASFIPIIGTLFFGLSLLERSGYMARSAFVIDKLMHKIGLPGKAFVPMVMGFGCSVPAIMASRTLELERERIATAMMSPFISCSARLPVYLLFAAAFFPNSGQNLVFLLYLVGILVAVSTGLLLKNTILPGNSGHYVMELPDYELPKLSSILLTTWHKLKSFVFGAGKTIVVVVMLLNVANSIDIHGNVHAPGEGDSVLSEVARFMTPMLAPIGIKPDNWPATVGLITGIFAKEAIVGTLNTLYSSTSSDSANVNLMVRWKEAVASIGSNLSAISPQDPLTIQVGTLENLDQAAQDQGVNVSTFDNLQRQFDGQAGAFAYLLFILLYLPCIAAMGALVTEVGLRWALFSALWSTGLAFALSTLFYQLANFTASPVRASSYIVLVCFLAVITWWSLKLKAKRIKLSTGGG